MASGRRSAGIVVFRRAAGPDGGLEVLLGHMGGPFWAHRDAGAWSVVKGEVEAGEEDEAAARREFTEELGLPVPDGPLVPLGEVRQSGGKVVAAWAVEADLDPAGAVFGTFTMEWPRGSGTLREFPELDRIAWLPLAAAREKVVAGQRPLLDRLAEARPTPPRGRR
ncbi:NUDIX domain-containing protein [Actinacidiphila yeochonensis]|uniref:NUDIX domain-containing protein n=1 Tax=Actinacidiphila yeochonensis TaxID=89050 RepID=UPI0005602D7C|nr:NUDIX domain-containing protein [Actinacidiphila yeochonensis]